MTSVWKTCAHTYVAFDNFDQVFFSQYLIYKLNTALTTARVLIGIDSAVIMSASLAPECNEVKEYASFILRIISARAWGPITTSMIKH